MVLGAILWVAEKIGMPVIETVVGDRIKNWLGGYFEKRRQKKIFEKAIKSTGNKRLEEEKEQLWPGAQPILFEESNQKSATKKLGDLIQPYVAPSEVANHAKRIVDECMRLIVKDLSEKHGELSGLLFSLAKESQATSTETQQQLEEVAQELGGRLDRLTTEITGSIEQMLRRREDYSSLFLGQTTDWDILAPKFNLHMHDLPYVEKPEFKEALKVVQDRKHLLIRGLAGSGRTKLLGELLRELAKTTGFEDEMVHFWRGGSISETIDGIWLCDDVERHHGEFEKLLQRMRDQGRQVQIFATVREERYDQAAFQRLLWPFRKGVEPRPDEVEIHPLTKQQTREIAKFAAQKRGLSIQGQLNISAPPAAIVFAIRSQPSSVDEIQAKELEEAIAKETKFVKEYIDELGKDRQLIPLLFSLRLLGWIQREGIFAREMVKRIYRHLGGDDLAFEFALRSCAGIIKIQEEDKIVIQNYILDNLPYHQSEHLDKLVGLKQIFTTWAREQKDTSYLYRLALLLNQEECWPDALEVVNEVLNFDRQLKDKSQVLNDQHLRGVILQNIGQLEEALAAHQEVLSLSKELGQKYGIAAAYNSIGLSLFHLGRLEDALQYYVEAYLINQELGNKFGMNDNHTNIGNLLDDLGRFEEALDQHQQSLQYAREVGSERDIVICLINMGWIRTQMGRLKEALQQHKEVYQKSKDQGYDVGMLASLNNQAVVLRMQGQLDAALQKSEEANQIANKLGQRLFFSEGLGIQGTVIMDTGQLEKALQMHQEAYQIAEEHGFMRLKGEILNRMGYVLLLLNRPREALGKHKDSYEIVQKQGFKAIMVEALTSMSRILPSLGGTSDALKLLDVALRIAVAEDGKPEKDSSLEEKKGRDLPQVVPPKGDFGLGIAKVLDTKGYVLMRLGRLEEALQHHQKAYQIAKERNYPLIEVNALSNIAGVLVRLKQVDEAMKQLEVATQRFQEIGVRSDVEIPLPDSANLCPEVEEPGAVREAAEQTLDKIHSLGTWASAKRVQQLLECLRQR